MQPAPPPYSRRGGEAWKDAAFCQGCHPSERKKGGVKVRLNVKCSNKWTVTLKEKEMSAQGQGNVIIPSVQQARKDSQ